MYMKLQEVLSQWETMGEYNRLAIESNDQLFFKIFVSLLNVLIIVSQFVYGSVNLHLHEQGRACGSC